MLRNSVYNTRKPKVDFAQELRKRQTPGEKSLWRKIRSRKFYGLKFRRQVPVGPFIVDFLCADRKLIIEVDGWTHGEPGAKEYDDRREKYLKNEGFDVLRISNSLATEDIGLALEKLGRFLGLNID